MNLTLPPVSSFSESNILCALTQRLSFLFLDDIWTHYDYKKNYD